jgi:hypothetical protein
MCKIILNLDEANNNVTDNDGVHVGVLTSPPVSAPDIQATLVLQLIKQGITVDEIIKLDNADLLK